MGSCWRVEEQDVFSAGLGSFHCRSFGWSCWKAGGKEVLLACPGSFPSWSFGLGRWGNSILMVEEQDVFLACRGSFPSSSFGGGCRRELLSWSGFVSVAEFWLGCRGSADTASRSLRHETTGMALATGSRGPLEAKPLCALFGLEMRYSFITSDAGRPIDCVSDSNYGDVGSFHEHKFLVGNN